MAEPTTITSAGHITGSPTGTLELRLDVPRRAQSEDSQAANTDSRAGIIPWPVDPAGMIEFVVGNIWLSSISNLLVDSVASARFDLEPREFDQVGHRIEQASDQEYATGMSWLSRENVARDGVTELNLAGLLKATTAHMDATGNVFLEVLRSRDGRNLSQLAVLLPQYLRYEATTQYGVRLEQMDPLFGLRHFLPHGSRAIGDASTREFLHQRLPNLVSSFYGLPAWIGARDSVALDNAHRAYMRNFFRAHAAPRWLVSVTQDPAWKDGVMPTDADIQTVYTFITNYLNANAGEMSGRNLVLRYPGGILVKIDALDVKVEDPTFEKATLNTRNEILAVRHVSLIDLGLPEGGYRATAETQSDNFRRQVLEPFAAPILGMLNRVLHMAPPYGLGIGTWDLKLSFERVEDTLKKLEAIFKAVGVPFLSPDEGRELAGYEPRNGALERVYAPSSMVPIDEEIGNPDAQATDTTDTGALEANDEPPPLE